jgi:hypothetical protein
MKGVVRDFDRRRQDQQLSRMTPVAYQRRNHDPGGDGGFRVLLADQQKELSDQLPSSIPIKSPKDRPDEIKDPILASLAERRLAGRIHDLERLEDFKRFLGLIGEER